MVDYVKRREAHGIELWVSTTWAHWKYVQFRRTKDQAVIYAGDKGPLRCGLKTFYAAFSEAVTPDDGATINAFDPDDKSLVSNTLAASLSVRGKLQALYWNYPGESFRA